jgi:O-antigen/teichoic acid export membrane protein
MLIRHSAIYVVAKVLPGVLGMLTTAILTHLLAPEEYGLYGLALVIMAFGSSMGFDWIGVSFLRYYQARKDDPLIISTFLQIFLGVVLLTAVGTLAAWLLGLFSAREAPVIAAGMVLLWAFAWFELTSKLEVGNFKPMRYFAMNMGRGSFALLGAVLAAWLTRSPEITAIGTAIGTAAGALLGGFRGWRLGRRYFDAALAKSVLAFGLPLAVSLTLGGVINSGTRALVAALDSAAGLGLYTAAFMLVQNTLAVIAAGIAAASYSLAVRAVETGDPLVARRQLLANGSLLLAVMAPASIGMALVSHGIANTLVGPQYTASVAELTPWMAIGTFFWTIRMHLLDHAFQLGRKPHLQIWVAAATAVAAVGLSVWLIPLEGPVGAAKAILGSMIFSCAIGYLLGLRAFPIPLPYGAAARIALACAVMAALVLSVPGSSLMSLAAQIALGGTGYAAVCVATNVLGARQAVLRYARVGWRKLFREPSTSAPAG